jgi:DNA polymerase-3 subunit beta
MKMSIDRKDLTFGLDAVSGAVSNKSPLPVLAHVLLHAEGDKLRLGATDLSMAIEATVPAQVFEPGACTVPAKVFMEIVKSLAQVDVMLEEKGPRLNVATSQTTFNVNSLSAEEFPLLPEPEDPFASVTVPAELLRYMLGSVLFAVAPPEETRAALTGVLLELNGDIAQVTSTDGRRLARVTKLLDGAKMAKYVAIVPGDALRIILSLLAGYKEAVRVTPGKDQVFFTFGNVRVCARLLLEGTFPAADSIIPKSHVRTMTCHRPSFLSAVRRALIMAQEKESPRLVKLAITGENMTLTANTPDLGDAVDHVPVRLEGDPLTIAFNGRYLHDTLSNIAEDEVRFFFNDHLSMATVRPGDSADALYLVMPVRIKEPAPVA